MVKKQATFNQCLESYRKEWKISRKKIVLSKALNFCRDRHLEEPMWLHDALYELGRSSVLSMEKPGRRMDILTDDFIYDAVLFYLREGLTQAKAFERVARRFQFKTQRGDDPGSDAYFTVRNAWLRHKKRIVKVGPGDFRYDPNHPWRFKEKYLYNLKWTKVTPLPPWLRRTKNK